MYTGSVFMPVVDNWRNVQGVKQKQNRESTPFRGLRETISEERGTNVSCREEIF